MTNRPPHYVIVTGAACLALFLVDWISDTGSQEYTGLQSLVKCLALSKTKSDSSEPFVHKQGVYIGSILIFVVGWNIETFSSNSACMDQ